MATLGYGNGAMYEGTAGKAFQTGGFSVGIGYGNGAM
jgi:hypothetical protein